MAGELAYDPVSEQLVYTPGGPYARQLARNCGADAVYRLTPCVERTTCTHCADTYKYLTFQIDEGISECAPTDCLAGYHDPHCSLIDGNFLTNSVVDAQDDGSGTWYCRWFGLHTIAGKFPCYFDFFLRDVAGQLAIRLIVIDYTGGNVGFFDSGWENVASCLFGEMQLSNTIVAGNCHDTTWPTADANFGEWDASCIGGFGGKITVRPGDIFGGGRCPGGHSFNADNTGIGDLSLYVGKVVHIFEDTICYEVAAVTGEAVGGVTVVQICDNCADCCVYTVGTPLTCVAP